MDAGCTEGAAGSRETVCVTGAGGYIASWLFNLYMFPSLGEEKTMAT